MRSKYFLAAILLFASISVFAQRGKETETTTVVTTDGIVYSLPRTGIRIHVKTTQEKYVHGPYYQYAETMLGIKNAPSTDQESWIIKEIRVETFSEADPKQVYKSLGAAASMLSLTEAGVLAGINTPAATEAEPIVVSTFTETSKAPDIAFLDLSLNPFFEEADSTSRNKTIVLKSLDEKAQEAANTITKLRKRRFLTLANNYDEQLPDGKAYEVMVKELGDLEENYVALFVGKTFKQTYEYSFDYIPGDNTVSGDVVFRFSDTNGVLQKTDMSGKPISIDVKKLTDLTSAQEKVKGTQIASSNIYYRMPGKAEIQILNGVSLMAASRADIAQFGTVATLPDELLNGSYEITFHPKTGAIKSILKKE